MILICERTINKNNAAKLYYYEGYIIPVFHISSFVQVEDVGINIFVFPSMPRLLIMRELLLHHTIQYSSTLETPT